MGETSGVSAVLRGWWAAGGVLLAMGLLLSVDGAVVVLLPGLLVLAVTGGITAAHGRRAGPRWQAAAWSAPLVPGALAGVAFAWLWHQEADPLAVVILVWVTVPVLLGTWVVFGLALLVEGLRLQRRRRFGDPRPAWKNDQTPPPYS